MTYAQIKIVVGVVAIVAIVAALAYFGFSLTEIVTIISAMTVSGSALATAYFAYMGLNTWKDKLKYDTARRLLISLSNYRSTMNDYINPFIPPTSESHQNTMQTSEETRLLKARTNQEDKRQAKLLSASKEFYIDIFMSGDLWGKEMQSIIQKMYDIEYIVLRTTMNQMTMAHLNTSPDQKQQAKQFLEDIKNDPAKQSEALSEEFNKLVVKAERILKSKMQL